MSFNFHNHCQNHGVMERDLLYTYSVLGMLFWKHFHAGSVFTFDVYKPVLVSLDQQPHCGNLAHATRGWAMQAAAYIFIHRKWKDDRSHFEDMIDYFCDIHEPLQLLIFPEGTDLTESTMARSNDFAEKNGLQKYEYVLHPRTTGFTFVVDRLREGKNLDAVHDITVAYPHNIPQTESHLLHGDFPKEIHFHVHRYPIDTLPTSKEDLELWCHRRWEEKEERLRSFYQGERNFYFTGQTVIPPCKSELRVLVVKLLSLVYWTLFSPAMCLLIYSYSLVQWYFIIIIVIFVLQERLFGGLEIMELACYRFLHKQSHSNAKKNA
nr:lysocardiolipin acyltransferase 1 isoform X3 [Vicugna pacos]